MDARQVGLLEPPLTGHRRQDEDGSGDVESNNKSIQEGVRLAPLQGFMAVLCCSTAG